MRIGLLVSWVLTVSGAIKLAIAAGFFIFAVGSSGVPGDSGVYWVIASQLVSGVVFGLSAIVLGLIVTYVDDLPNAKVRKWDEWKYKRKGLSIGECITLALRVSAILWIVISLLSYVDAFVRGLPNDPITIATSAIVQTLALGFSGIAIAIIKDRVSAVAE